ncbi:hypothetical protein PAPYR_11461 [Paratrimastix pyriformis]|uniref:DNA-directed DNA polymerase n=1 Tax=Paratrimastix pyriformis TaxID=342808 RepID=A0ABQ8U3S9_9EUKA|nr:hypothetical protein PAPYR_11461 [Paratrimastix pyriformis]
MNRFIGQFDALDEQVELSGRVTEQWGDFVYATRPKVCKLADDDKKAAAKYARLMRPASELLESMNIPPITPPAPVPATHEKRARPCTAADCATRAVIAESTDHQLLDRFDALIAEYPDEFKQQPVPVTAKSTKTIAQLRETVSRIAMTAKPVQQYQSAVNPIQIAYAKWCIASGAIPCDLKLPTYQPPPPPVTVPATDVMGCTRVEHDGCSKAVRDLLKRSNETLKLADVDATNEPMPTECRNMMAFDNNVYITRNDGTIGILSHINYDPALQRPDCFRATGARHEIMKAVNEFGITFTPAKRAVVAWDIETYSTSPTHRGVPQYTDPLSHIGMICGVYTCKGEPTERHAFIWEDAEPRPIDCSKLTADTVLHVSVSEQEMCCEFIIWVREMGKRHETLLVGWNTNQNLFFEKDGYKNHATGGYDLPFLANRCGGASVMQPVYQYGRGAGTGVCNSSLFGLHVHLVDIMAWIKAQLRAADSPDNYKLDTVLAFFKLTLKQRHGMTYAKMNTIMADPTHREPDSEHCFENIIRYCIYDCEAVISIMEAQNFDGKMDCFMEVCHLSLSQYLMYTQASWGMGVWMQKIWKYRDDPRLRKCDYGVHVFTEEEEEQIAAAREKTPGNTWAKERAARDLRALIKASHEADPVRKKYTGAINWSQYDYLVATAVVMFDFKSLYPSMILAYRISPHSIIDSFQTRAAVMTDGRTPENTAVVYNPTEEETTQHNARLEGVFNPLKMVREDDTFLAGQYTAFAKLEHDPLIETVEGFLSGRDEQKRLLKAARAAGNEHAAKYHDTMQYCIKILANSVYGLMGGPYACFAYDPRCAAAVTAAARDAITRASAILSKRGIRLFIDTDSTAVELSPALIPHIDLSNAEGIAALRTWAGSLERAVNEEVRQSYIEAGLFPAEHVKYISFQFEAIFTRALFAKTKTYFKRALAMDNLRVGMKPKPENKGCQFSVQSHYVRDRTLALIDRLLDTPRSLHAPALFKFYTDELTNIQAHPMLYTRKQKLSGEDLKVKSLKRRHPELEMHDMCQIIRVVQRSGKSSSDAWEPIDEEHIPCNIDYIEALHMAYTGNITRYFPIWRSLLPRSKALKCVGSEMVEVGELTFGIESLASANRKAVNCAVDGLRELLMSNRETRTVHEQLNEPIHKAFFDLEINAPAILRIEAIVREIEGILGHGCALVLDLCGPKKQSYHVVCQVLVPSLLNKRIALYLHDVRGYACVDCGVYSKGHTLRCFAQDKIATDAKTGKRYMEHRCVRLPTDPHFDDVTIEQILASLITYTEGVPTLAADVLNFDRELIDVECPYVPLGDYPRDLIAYLNTRFNEGEWTAEAAGNNMERIKVNHSYTCPICEREHDSDGGFVTRTKDAYRFHCSRNPKQLLPFPCDERPATFDELLHTYYKNLPAPVPDHRADEYMVHDIKQKLTCIKAYMGSGKTQNLARILTEVDPACRAILVSCRRTLAFDYMRRFNVGASRPFESYMDLRGSISVHQHPRLIIQADSLGRVNIGDLRASKEGEQAIKYLILDEIESLLIQIASTNSARVVQHLYELMINADHVVVMDGNLQQSTTRLLEDMLTHRDTAHPVTAESVLFTKVMPRYNVRIMSSSFSARGSKRTGLTYTADQIVKLLKQGKRVACFISILGVLRSIEQYVKAAIPEMAVGHRIRVLTGRDKEMHEHTKEDKSSEMVTHFAEKREFLSGDIGEHLREENTSLFMYTSTITAGVDINIDYFDTFVHVLSTHISPIELTQAMFRVRKYRMNEGLIIYKHSGGKPFNALSLEDALTADNNVARVFRDGRCDLSLEQQVLMMLAARNLELHQKCLNFVVATLAAHNFALQFCDLTAETPEIEPVDYLVADRTAGIAALLGWRKDAEDEWSRVDGACWIPAEGELSKFGKKNCTAVLMDEHDPLFADKDQWFTIARDLGMQPAEGLELEPKYIEMYFHGATREAYKAAVRAQKPAGLALLQQVYDLTNGKEAVTRLPPDVVIPTVDERLANTRNVLAATLRSDSVVNAAGLEIRASKPVGPMGVEAVRQSLVSRVHAIAEKHGAVAVFSVERDRMNDTGREIQALFERSRDELRTAGVTLRANESHNALKTLLTVTGYTPSKPTSLQFRVPAAKGAPNKGGKLCRAYSITVPDVATQDTPAPRA